MLTQQEIQMLKDSDWQINEVEVETYSDNTTFFDFVSPARFDNDKP